MLAVMALRAAAVIVGVLAAGCAAPEKLPDVRGGPEIGLRRGNAWSTLTVRPPHIVGPDANLILRDSVLSGSLGGELLSVRIVGDGADGHAPAGPVSLTFRVGPASLEASGMWNGNRVRLTFAEDSLHGSVSRWVEELNNSMFSPAPNPDAPGPRPDANCQYVLTELGSDGALSGTSICAGMPVRTRLEVPRSIQAWMTRSELVVVLVALLSAPPGVDRLEERPLSGT